MEEALPPEVQGVVGGKGSQVEKEAPRGFPILTPKDPLHSNTTQLRSTEDQHEEEAGGDQKGEAANEGGEEVEEALAPERERKSPQGEEEELPAHIPAGKDEEGSGGEQRRERVEEVFTPVSTPEGKGKSFLEELRRRAKKKVSQTPQPVSTGKKKNPKKKVKKQEDTAEAEKEKAQKAVNEKLKKLLHNWRSKVKTVDTDNTVTHSSKRKTVEPEEDDVEVEERRVNVTFEKPDRKKPVDVGVVDKKPDSVFDRAMQKFSMAGAVVDDNDSFETWKRKRAEKRKKEEVSDMADEDLPRKRKNPPGIVRKPSSRNINLKTNAIFDNVSCSSLAGDQGQVQGAGVQVVQGGQEHIVGHGVFPKQPTARKTRQRAGQGESLLNDRVTQLLGGEKTSSEGPK